MCVEGQRELYQANALNSRLIFSVKLSQIAQLTPQALTEQLLYLFPPYHFLWSSLMSHVLLSAFLMMSSTAPGTLWMGFIELAGVVWFQDVPFELSEIPGLD